MWATVLDNVRTDRQLLSVSSASMRGTERLIWKTSPSPVPIHQGTLVVQKLTPQRGKEMI